MTLSLHPALRALGLTLGGLALLVGGSLAAYTGMKSLAQAGMPAPPTPVATTPPPPAQGADPAATMERARLLARQSHGDWSRLSAADQRLLDGPTGGRGRDLLRSIVREQAAPRETAGARPTMSSPQQRP
jgi:hypothetical protein